MGLKESAAPQPVFGFRLPSLKGNLKEKMSFILVFLTILIISATFFRQTLVNTIKLIKDNKEKQLQLGKLTLKANFLNNLDQNQLEKRVRELEQVFPSKKPALETINFLNILAVEDGISLSSLHLSPGKLEEETPLSEKSPEKSAAKTSIEDFSLKFSIAGEKSKVLKFIKDLEKTAPLTKIEDLAITLGEKKEDSQMLKLSLSVRVYYQLLPQSLPSVETPAVYLTQEEEQILDELAVFKYYPLVPLPDVTIGKENLFKKTP